MQITAADAEALLCTRSELVLVNAALSTDVQTQEMLLGLGSMDILRGALVHVSEQLGETLCFLHCGSFKSCSTGLTKEVSVYVATGSPAATWEELQPSCTRVHVKYLSDEPHVSDSALQRLQWLLDQELLPVSHACLTCAKARREVVAAVADIARDIEQREELCLSLSDMDPCLVKGHRHVQAELASCQLRLKASYGALAQRVEECSAVASRHRTPRSQAAAADMDGAGSIAACKESSTAEPSNSAVCEERTVGTGAPGTDCGCEQASLRAGPTSTAAALPGGPNPVAPSVIAAWPPAAAMFSVDQQPRQPSPEGEAAQHGVATVKSGVAGECHMAKSPKLASSPDDRSQRRVLREAARRWYGEQRPAPKPTTQVPPAALTPYAAVPLLPLALCGNHRVGPAVLDATLDASGVSRTTAGGQPYSPTQHCSSSSSDESLSLPPPSPVSEPESAAAGSTACSPAAPAHLEHLSLPAMLPPHLRHLAGPTPDDSPSHIAARLAQSQASEAAVQPPGPPSNHLPQLVAPLVGPLPAEGATKSSSVMSIGIDEGDEDMDIDSPGPCQAHPARGVTTAQLHQATAMPPAVLLCCPAFARGNAALEQPVPSAGAPSAAGAPPSSSAAEVWQQPLVVSPVMRPTWRSPVQPTEPPVDWARQLLQLQVQEPGKGQQLQSLLEQLKQQHQQRQASLAGAGPEAAAEGWPLQALLDQVLGLQVQDSHARAWQQLVEQLQAMKQQHQQQQQQQQPKQRMQAPQALQHLPQYPLPAQHEIRQEMAVQQQQQQQQAAAQMRALLSLPVQQQPLVANQRGPYPFVAAPFVPFYPQAHMVPAAMQVAAASPAMGFWPWPGAGPVGYSSFHAHAPRGPPPAMAPWPPSPPSAPGSQAPFPPWRGGTYASWPTPASGPPAARGGTHDPLAGSATALGVALPVASSATAPDAAGAAAPRPCTGLQAPAAPQAVASVAAVSAAPGLPLPLPHPAAGQVGSSAWPPPCPPPNVAALPVLPGMQLTGLRQPPVASASVSSQMVQELQEQDAVPWQGPVSTTSTHPADAAAPSKVKPVTAARPPAPQNTASSSSTAGSAAVGLPPGVNIPAPMPQGSDLAAGGLDGSREVGSAELSGQAAPAPAAAFCGVADSAEASNGVLQEAPVPAQLHTGQSQQQLQGLATATGAMQAGASDVPGNVECTAEPHNWAGTAQPGCLHLPASDTVVTPTDPRLVNNVQSAAKDQLSKAASKEGSSLPAQGGGEKEPGVAVTLTACDGLATSPHGKARGHTQMEDARVQHHPAALALRQASAGCALCKRDTARHKVWRGVLSWSWETETQALKACIHVCKAGKADPNNRLHLAKYDTLPRQLCSMNEVRPEDWLRYWTVFRHKWDGSVLLLAPRGGARALPGENLESHASLAAFEQRLQSKGSVALARVLVPVEQHLGYEHKLYLFPRNSTFASKHLWPAAAHLHAVDAGRPLLLCLYIMSRNLKPLIPAESVPEVIPPPMPQGLPPCAPSQRKRRDSHESLASTSHRPLSSSLGASEAVPSPLFGWGAPHNGSPARVRLPQPSASGAAGHVRQRDNSAAAVPAAPMSPLLRSAPVSATHASHTLLAVVGASSESAAAARSRPMSNAMNSTPSNGADSGTRSDGAALTTSTFVAAPHVTRGSPIALAPHSDKGSERVPICGDVTHAAPGVAELCGEGDAQRPLTAPVGSRPRISWMAPPNYKFTGRYSALVSVPPPCASTVISNMSVSVAHVGGAADRAAVAQQPRTLPAPMLRPLPSTSHACGGSTPPLVQSRLAATATGPGVPRQHSVAMSTQKVATLCVLDAIQATLDTPRCGASDAASTAPSSGMCQQGTGDMHAGLPPSPLQTSCTSAAALRHSAASAGSGHVVECVPDVQQHYVGVVHSIAHTLSTAAQQSASSARLQGAASQAQAAGEAAGTSRNKDKAPQSSNVVTVGPLKAGSKPRAMAARCNAVTGKGKAAHVVAPSRPGHMFEHKLAEQGGGKVAKPAKKRAAGIALADVAVGGSAGPKRPKQGAAAAASAAQGLVASVAVGEFVLSEGEDEPLVLMAPRSQATALADHAMAAVAASTTAARAKVIYGSEDDDVLPVAAVRARAASVVDLVEEEDALPLAAIRSQVAAPWTSPGAEDDLPISVMTARALAARDPSLLGSAAAAGGGGAKANSAAGGVVEAKPRASAMKRPRQPKAVPQKAMAQATGDAGQRGTPQAAVHRDGDDDVAISEQLLLTRAAATKGAGPIPRERARRAAAAVEEARMAATPLRDHESAPSGQGAGSAQAASFLESDPPNGTGSPPPAARDAAQSVSSASDGEDSGDTALPHSLRALYLPLSPPPPPHTPLILPQKDGARLVGEPRVGNALPRSVCTWLGAVGADTLARAMGLYYSNSKCPYIKSWTPPCLPCGAIAGTFFIDANGNYLWCKPIAAGRESKQVGIAHWAYLFMRPCGNGRGMSLDAQCSANEVHAEVLVPLFDAARQCWLWHAHRVELRSRAVSRTFWGSLERWLERALRSIGQDPSGFLPLSKAGKSRSHLPLLGSPLTLPADSGKVRRKRRLCNQVGSNSIDDRANAQLGCGLLGGAGASGGSAREAVNVIAEVMIDTLQVPCGASSHAPMTDMGEAGPSSHVFAAAQRAHGPFQVEGMRSSEAYALQSARLLQ